MEQTRIFPSWQASFKKEYGEKLAFIEKCQEYHITTHNTLLIVRGEHGGFFPFFLGRDHGWAYKWYESPIYENLHRADTAQDILKILKQEHIEYIVAMDDSELERFYDIPFSKSNPLFKEYLIKMIRNKNSILQLLYSEPKDLGLELTLYRVTG